MLHSNTWKHLIVFKSIIIVNRIIRARNTWIHLNGWKKMSPGSFKSVTYRIRLQYIYIIYIENIYVCGFVCLYMCVGETGFGIK